MMFIEFHLEGLFCSTKGGRVEKSMNFKVKDLMFQVSL